MKAKILITTFIVILLSALTGTAGDPPHNAASDVNCSDCHGMTLLDSQSPFWTDNTTDAAYCAICLRCHTLGNVSPYNAGNAPPVVTHKEIKCTTCHHNHDQDQIYTGKNNRSDFFLATGTTTSAVYSSGSDTTTITYSSLEATDPGSDWAADLTLLAEKTDSGRGALLIPDRTSRKRWSLYIIVAIDDPASDTIRVKGNATDATNIAIIYGQLIRGKTKYDPVHSTSRSVKLYNQEGAYAFAQNDEAVDVAPPDTILDDSTPDGNCQVCHTSTNHWRNDGTKSENHYSGQNCMRCHPHTGGFLHGGGAGGPGCIECHGHDDGTLYDPSMSVPYTPGTSASIGAGTFQSHSTHTETDIDDLKGPGIYCDTCHDITNFPYFKTGTDDNGDGLIELSETDVCDTCHSSGGSYDGLDDSVVGARQIWSDGAYAATDDSTLRPGKEKWCATCHDETPSQIQSVNAPNVIGDEDGSYTYGTGWGYYRTGHGLTADEQYPSKGGVETLAGRPLECDSCHDYASVHIDGNARTFDDGGSGSLDPGVYRQGYRLKQVAAGFGTGAGGKEPLMVPRTQNSGNAVNQYRLCADCHGHDPAFLDENDLTATNLVTTHGGDGTQNRHATHLNMNSTNWASDWDGVYNSRMTCMSCHNVHGSRRLAMVRDGKLTGLETPGAEEGLLIWYKNEAISIYNSGNPDPPTPENIPLSASDGTIWIGESSSNLCSHCHGSINSIPESRPPFQDVSQAPILDWTGEAGFVSDGASPDSGTAGSSFEFRVQYTDTNNNAPTLIQVWIDINDSSTYELSEKHNMNAVDPGDINHTDGKLYSRSIIINQAGDNILSYKFYASDGGSDAVGPPTDEGSIVIFSGGAANNAPLLEWIAGTCRHEGVSPRAEVSGTTFGFTVTYTDADDECPPAPGDIQVWIDENDNGTYEPTEKHNLNEVDAGDTVCSDGKLYSYSQSLALAGDNLFNYRFVASDGTDSATGEPLDDHEVTVIDSGTTPLRTVCSSGCDFTTIQAAINGINGTHTVLVHAGTYIENLALDGTNDDNTIIRSRCGKGNTIINGSATVIDFQWNNTGSVVDGFGITGGTRGVGLNGAAATVRNSSIYGNDIGTGSGGGIYSTNSASRFTLVKSEVYSNSAANGAGIYFNNGIHTITDSVIRNNTATGSGAAINFQWTGTGTAITGTTIKDNASTGNGGAMFFNGGQADFYKSLITGNSSSGSGGAAYMTNGTSAAHFENCILADNRGAQGGAILVNGGTTSFINTTLADNQSTSGNGGAIYLDCPTTTVRNSIFWNNTSAGSGSNIYKACGGGNAGTVTDSDISTAAGFVDGGTLTTANNIDPAADPKFVGTGDYHILSDSAVIDQAAAAYAPVDDIDGDSRPQGAADDMGADEYTSGPGAANTIPVLSWTGEPDYTADGINPGSGNSGSSFTFRVDYTDMDNDAPVLMQVWVDENANGVYGAAEKYAMTVVGGDGDYTNGERYTKSLTLNAAGGGILQYRFYASDGTDEATGSPISDKTVTLINNIPVLDWTGEINYTTDGVDPDSAAGGSSFTFRVEYTDADNTAPASIQVWIDTDDSATYEPGEKTALTVAGGDGDYTNGEFFSATLVLAHIGTGSLNYRFYATDGTDPATGPPTSDKTVTVAAPAGNNTPSLSWSTAGCLTNGVRPGTGAEDTNFEFLITYTDADNQCADIIQVWIDENDNGSFESSEKYDLTERIPADVDCTDGKTYSAARPLALAGDGTLDYRFFATDGIEAATGSPVSAAQVTVISGFKVRPAGGTGWYTSIQAAVNDSADPSTILVYPNADFTTATYTENIEFKSKPNRTLRSVCGADLTIVTAAAGTVVLLQSDNLLMDGFTATGGDTAVYINTGNPITVKNSRMHTSSYGIYVNNGAQATIDNNEIYNNTTRGIHTNPSTTNVTISDCTIRDNGSAGSGAGIYFNYGVHTVTDTVIRDNTAGSGDGGGIYFNGAGAGTTLTNVTISGNQATDTTLGRGGGMYIGNGSQVSFDKCTITNNRSTASAGGGLYITYGTTSVTMTNTVVAANQATKGGAAYLHSGAVSFINDTFADNQATAGTGGVFAVCNLTSNTVRNSIFWNNTATGSGNNAYKECGAALFMTVTDSDISTGAGFIDGGTITAGSNMDPAVDPIFVGGGDYHLQAGSPVINQANATYAPVDDIDGDIRPQGPADDMGADEYSP